MNEAVSLPQEGSSQNVRRPGLWLAALILYGLALYLPYLGSYPLGSHEALAAQRTRELMSYGKWVIPYRNGEPDMNKPPLPFWIGGAFAAVAGDVNEWTARIPSALAAVGVMLLLVFWMRRVIGWRTGLLAGFLFLTSYTALSWGRRAEVDMQLTFWTTASIVCYWFGIHEINRRSQVKFFLLMWATLGLGFMTKGPFPLAFLAITVAACRIAGGPKFAVRKILPLVGPLVMLAFVVPWALLAVKVYPDAWNVWYEQSLGRYSGNLGHAKGPFYYVLRTPMLWLPWIVQVAAGIWMARKPTVMPRTAYVYLLAWGVGGILFLSLGTGKRVFYALPCMMPFFAFAGLATDRFIFASAAPDARPKRRLAVICAALLAVGGAAGVYFGAGALPQLAAAVTVLAIGATIGIAAIIWFLSSRRRFAALVAFAVSLLVIDVVATGFIVQPLLQNDPEATIGKMVAHDTTGVCFYGTYRRTIAYYADRVVPQIETPEELTAWLAKNPHGSVIIDRRKKGLDLPKIGTWQERIQNPDSDYGLLQAE